MGTAGWPRRPADLTRAGPRKQHLPMLRTVLPTCAVLLACVFVACTSETDPESSDPVAACAEGTCPQWFDDAMKAAVGRLDSASRAYLEGVDVTDVDALFADQRVLQFLVVVLEELEKSAPPEATTQTTPPHETQDLAQEDPDLDKTWKATIKELPEKALESLTCSGLFSLPCRLGLSAVSVAKATTAKFSQLKEKVLASTGQEVCDGKDNDKDGQTDEGFNVGMDCVLPASGCPAKIACDLDELSSSCTEIPCSSG